MTYARFIAIFILIACVGLSADAQLKKRIAVAI